MNFRIFTSPNEKLPFVAMNRVECHDHNRRNILRCVFFRCDLDEQRISQRLLSEKKCVSKIPSRELTYPPPNHFWVDDFPCPNVGNVSLDDSHLLLKQHQPLKITAKKHGINWTSQRHQQSWTILPDHNEIGSCLSEPIFGPNGWKCQTHRQSLAARPWKMMGLADDPFLLKMVNFQERKS